MFLRELSFSENFAWNFYLFFESSKLRDSRQKKIKVKSSSVPFPGHFKIGHFAAIRFYVELVKIGHFQILPFEVQKILEWTRDDCFMIHTTYSLNVLSQAIIGHMLHGSGLLTSFCPCWPGCEPVFQSYSVDLRTLLTMSVGMQT